MCINSRLGVTITILLAQHDIYNQQKSPTIAYMSAIARQALPVAKSMDYQRDDLLGITRINTFRFIMLQLRPIIPNMETSHFQ